MPPAGEWTDDVDRDRWTKLKGAFAVLMDLDPAERGRHLDQLTSADEGLGTMLRALVDADGRADSVLERFTVLPMAQDGSRPDAAVGPGPVADPLGLVGRTVAHFQVREVLGAGGMGVIYRAEDARLKRTVALKFLLPQYALDPAARDRFVREARAASALDHPNVCTVLEVGEGDEAGPFLAMPCYDGTTLSGRLASGAQLPVAEILGITRQVLSGLRAAHEAGIVHRDLKPGNLMLTRNGAVKILDFGLAKVRDVDLTEPGARPGTVSYMSPEQLGGGTVDPRTDLWSLGVVLYEMLTGRTPFGRPHDLATLYSILHGEPAPPSTLRDGVGAALDQIVGTLLAKDPGERYATAADVLADLEAASRQPKSAPRGSREPDSRVPLPWVAAHPTAAVAAHQSSVAEEPASIAVLPFRDLSVERDQEYLCDGLTEEIIGQLSRVEGLRVTARTSSFRFRDRSADLSEMGRQLGVKHLLDGSVRVSGDILRVGVELVVAATGDRVWSETYERRKADVFALQDEIGRAIVASLQLHLAPDTGSLETPARTASPDAYELFLRGRYFGNTRTETGLTRAAEYYRQAIAADPGFARAHAGLAEALISPVASASGARFRAGRTAASQALALDPELAEAHTAMGWIKLWYDRDWSGAEWHFQRAVSSNPGYLWAHQWYAAYLAAVGRLDEALTAIRRAQRIDPLSVSTATHVGTILFWMRRYEEAMGTFRRALGLRPGFFMARWGVGRALVHLQRPDEAVPELEAEGSNFVGFFQPGLLGHAFAVAGREDRARDILTGLLQAAERGAHVAPTDLAAIYIGLGEHHRALDWLERHEADRGARIFLRVDPIFDPVREHPRFNWLLERLGPR